MLFGTVAGSLADTLGRKRGALAYVVVYAASCATKHWRSYNVLMVGRVLGGVATSLLFSVFDAWLVSEHTARGFEPAWLSSTFANAQARRPASVTTSLRLLTCKTQAGNSLVAIAAGVIGEWAAGLSQMRVLVAGGDDSAVADAGGPDGAIMVGGYCAPFDLAAAVLLVGGVVILLTWSENYGERAGGADSSYAAREKGATFPTSKAPLSAVFHSFRLIFGRAIISRSALDAWMLLSGTRARGTPTLKRC